MPEPYYQDSSVTLYHGGCRDILPALATVDAVITDRPTVSGHITRSARERCAPPTAAQGGAASSRVVSLGFEALTPPTPVPWVRRQDQPARDRPAPNPPAPTDAEHVYPDDIAHPRLERPRDHAHSPAVRVLRR